MYRGTEGALQEKNIEDVTIAESFNIGGGGALNP